MLHTAVSEQAAEGAVVVRTKRTMALGGSSRSHMSRQYNSLVEEPEVVVVARMNKVTNHPMVEEVERAVRTGTTYSILPSLLTEHAVAVVEGTKWTWSIMGLKGHTLMRLVAVLMVALGKSGRTVET